MTTRSEVIVVDRVCLICWRGRPSADSVRTVAEKILQARRQLGRPLTLVAIAAADMQLPDAEARSAFMRLTPIVDRTCEAQYIVVQGEGPSRRLVRGFAAAVLMIMRAPVVMCASVSEAVSLACAQAGQSTDAVRAALGAHGFALE